jgi:hypothetical protein
LAWIGQLGFSHDAPRAFFSTTAGSSFNAPKKSRHSASTLEGSFSNFA